jgi:multidrug efflux pump subunit AcrB
MRVAMDAERMNAHGVTAQDLKAALQLSNALQPSGSLVTGNREMLVETGTYLETAADVKRLVVGVQDGRPVFMSDVARDSATAPTSPRNMSGTAPRRASSRPSPCRSPRSPA